MPKSKSQSKPETVAQQETGGGCQQEPCCASLEPIHDWFSLSYASYLVIPRTILQSCTPENQQRLVDALDAIYDETLANMDEQWPHEAVIEVKLKDCATGRYRKDGLANYERGRRRLWHNVKEHATPLAGASLETGGEG